MNDPHRYTEDGGDEALRAGLRSLRGDRPSNEARDRTLALVVGATAATTLTAAGTATGATAGAAATAQTKAATALLFAKWAGVGVAAGTLALGGYDVATRPPATAPAPSVAAVHPAVSGPTTGGERPALTVASAPAASATLPAEIAPTAEIAPRFAFPGPAATTPPSSPPSAPATASTAPTVADEVQKLEVVRAAIRAHDGAGARAAIAAYRRAFPRGILTSEAFVLEIEIAALDDRAAARRMAEAFLDKNPTSPLAARVRRAGGLPEPSAP